MSQAALPLRDGSAVTLRRVFLAGVILDGVLLVIGLRVFPTTLTASSSGPSGFIAALAVLLAYAGLAWFGLPRIAQSSPPLIGLSARFGLLAGAVFALEILAEYVFLPKDNSLYGLVEYGLVFLLFFLTALLAARQTGKIRRGVLAAVACALLASLIWLAVLLLTTYLFHHTPQQAQLLQAEGTQFDFQRSGMTDFDAFVMQDYLGAAFFHLLLAPFLAALLGLIGGLVGRIGTQPGKLK